MRFHQAMFYDCAPPPVKQYYFVFRFGLLAGRSMTDLRSIITAPRLSSNSHLDRYGIAPDYGWGGQGSVMTERQILGRHR